MEDSWWNAQFCLVASLHEQAHIVHIFSVTCIFSSLRVRGLSILTLTVVLIPCHCGGMFQSMDMTPAYFIHDEHLYGSQVGDWRIMLIRMRLTLLVATIYEEL